MRLKKLLSSAYIVGSLLSNISYVDGALLEVASVTAQAVRTAVRHTPTSLRGASAYRHFSTGRLYQPGIYTQATEDPIFKYLMHDNEVRNSFLSGVIGEEVLASELLDSSLNPMRSYTALRELLNRGDIKALMQDVQEGEKTVEVRNTQTKYPLKRLTRFLQELSPLYHELLQAIPDVERNTQLDLVCETDTGLVNVEIQVEPQDFWDIRILDHACGLFHRQFPRGFQWSDLSSDVDIRHKVKRVIGVSIFEKPPVSPESVHALLPWYTLEPWRPEELRRTYRLLETRDPTKARAGLEFFDYNLSALPYLDDSEVLSEGGEGLKEWLDLLANAQFKTKDEVTLGVKLPSVQRAYHLLESESLPEKVKRAYDEAQKRRFQISHYVADEKSKSREEGERLKAIEIARNLIKMDLSDDQIIKATGFTAEEVAAIRDGKPVDSTDDGRS